MIKGVKITENKELVTSNKITQLLIGNWLLWSIVFGFIYSFVFSLVTAKIESKILVAIIAIITHGVMIFVIWKLSTSTSFKKKTIYYDDVPKVMKNLIIFTIVICLFNSIYNISTVNNSIDKTLQSNYKLKYIESMMSYLYSDAQIEEYQAQKEKTIQKTKNELYTYLVILEIGLTAVYLAILPLEKKEILKYVR